MRFIGNGLFHTAFTFAMGKARINLSAVEHRQRIHDLMEKISEQRKLIENLEGEEKDARTAKLVLRGMLTALEKMLLEYQQTKHKGVRK